MKILTSREIEWWLFKDGSTLPKEELKKNLDTKWINLESLKDWIVANGSQGKSLLDLYEQLKGE